MNERPIGLIIVGLGFAGFFYTFLFPERVKEANELPKYRGMGFGSKPVLFWRILGLIGSLAAGAEWFHVLLKK